MKRLFKLTAISLVAVFLLAGAHAPASGVTYPVPSITYPTGLKIMVYDGNNFETNSSGFAGNWTNAGNTVDYVLSYDFASNATLSSYDAILLPRTMGLNEANITAISTWFHSGHKFLWVGADSDYSGLWLASDTANPLLTKVNTNLRVDAGSIEDPQSNDQAAYRVVANETGVSSPITDYVTKDFVQEIFHGPAAVTYQDGANGDYMDLRNATLANVGTGNISIIVNASAAAVASDSDLSLTGADFYGYSSVSGNYPMLASDVVGNSMVVVSGESIFTDYKYMYGNALENSQAWHNGSIVVDRVVNWYADHYYQAPVTTTPTTSTTPATSPTSSTGTTPFSVPSAFFGLTAIFVTTVYIRRREKNKY